MNAGYGHAFWLFDVLCHGPMSFWRTTQHQAILLSCNHLAMFTIPISHTCLLLVIAGYSYDPVKWAVTNQPLLTTGLVLVPYNSRKLAVTHHDWPLFWVKIPVLSLCYPAAREQREATRSSWQTIRSWNCGFWHLGLELCSSTTVVVTCNGDMQCGRSKFHGYILVTTMVIRCL